MEKEEGRKVLDLVCMMGGELLRNGAEIARVHDTMHMVGEALGKSDVDVFAISNGIFVTMHHEDQTRCTQIKYIPLTSSNLGRVAMINQLSREICEGKWTIDEALAQMKKIAATPPVSLPWQLGSSAMGSACFCYLLGGSLADSLACVPIAMLVALFLWLAGRANISKMMQTIMASALLTLCGMFASNIFPFLHMDRVTIGALVLLVPGVPLTTSIRDFFNGDYLSGTVRLIDAVLVGICMAIGVGVVYRLFY